MFDPRVTSDIHSFVLQIASASLGDLMESMRAGHRYGYIGTEDWTMYPLIRPGAMVRIDESRQRISSGPWATESERPIYFLETRSGFACCWCAVMEGNIILQPHPLSPQPVRILSLSEEVDIIGQVVAVAMRLDRFPENR
jgi:hypothetical protein